MAINVSDKQIPSIPKQLHESSLNSPQNSHFKINFNSNDVHSMHRNKKTQQEWSQ